MNCTTTSTNQSPTIPPSTHPSIHHPPNSSESERNHRPSKNPPFDIIMLHGIGNFLESSALPNGLPPHQNNPQKHPLNLFTEQLSGTSFTKQPRAANRFTWLYRLLPSVRRTSKSTFKEFTDLKVSRDHETLEIDLNPGRWFPLVAPPSSSSSSSSSSNSSSRLERADFLEGLRLFGIGGEVALGEGISIYQFVATRSMIHRCFSSSDGEFLVVLQTGRLRVQTEMGEFTVTPEEIFVIPRGIKFRISLLGGGGGGGADQTEEEEGPGEDKLAVGYVLEVYNEGGFRLPELGPIGANGLANPHHFEVPRAKFDDPSHYSWFKDEAEEEEEGERGDVYANKWEYVVKVGGKWFHAHSSFTPFDVVAWRGNYFPYKYDLRKFCVINTVSFDHPDPSIFTVLTCPSSTAGVAAADFVIFPERWMVAEHTFRPPYFHVNCMSEYMGLIKGVYDGKAQRNGFLPGGCSLHNRFMPHGPDAVAHANAVEAPSSVPVKLTGTLAFMFETYYLVKTTDWARNGAHRDASYAKESWGGFHMAKL